MACVGPLSATPFVLRRHTVAGVAILIVCLPGDFYAVVFRRVCLAPQPQADDKKRTADDDHTHSDATAPSRRARTDDGSDGDAVPKAVNPIADGYTSLTAYLCVADGAAALEWYTRVLPNCRELFRFPTDDGKVLHAELQVRASRRPPGAGCARRKNIHPKCCQTAKRKNLGASLPVCLARHPPLALPRPNQVGNAKLMLSDEAPKPQLTNPKATGRPTSAMYLYTDNVDAAFAAAIAAGAVETSPLTDQWYGDRSGELRDPFGHQWTFSQHVKDVAPPVYKEKFAEVEAGVCVCARL